MRIAALALVTLATVALAAPAAAQESLMREGLWRISIQMSMPDMPMQMPAFTTEQCVTPEMAADPESVVPQGPIGGPTPDAGGSDCRIVDYDLDGRTATWRMECTEPPMTGDGEMTFSDDRYTGLMRMTMPDRGEMQMRYDAERVGACAP